jgi:hypothetical protein
MEQSSWKTDSYTTSHSPCIMGAECSLPWSHVPAMSQISLVYILPPYLFNIHSDIFPSLPSSFGWSLHVTFSSQIFFVCISHIPNVCYMHSAFRLLWFHHNNNIWRTVYKLWSCLLSIFLQSPITSSVLRMNSLSAPLSQTPPISILPLM